MLILIFLGVPVGWCIGAACLLTMLIFPGIPFLMVIQNCFTGLDAFTLLAIPFFILAGTLMATGGIARRLMNAANAIFGFFTGGLAMVATASCMFFGAVCGSAVATTSAIGSIMIPEMKKHKYDETFAAAIVASSGTIGVIIPPSVPFVIYAVATGSSVSAMFLAGFIPGILMGLGLMVTAYVTCRKNNYGEKVKFLGFKGLLKTIWDAKWALLAPVIILGGIYSGVFTPTEASVVAVVYALIIGLFVYKEFTVKDLFGIFREAGIISAVTTFMLTFSTTFAYYLTMKRFPQMVAGFLGEVTDSMVITLLIINLFLLIVGSLIDNLPATLILAPILLPVVKAYGMSPIQFGIIMTVNLAIGYVTPPYGLNLFTVCALSGLKLEDVTKKVIWPILALLVILLLITYYPPLSMVFIK
jgi:C4-dicarboxylate transporter DctM subunit